MMITILYSWEQNDRGAAAGTSLLNNTKADGPLFAMFPKSGQITDTLVYTSPGENHLTTIPTRVFPDLQQILDNNTNADTGACPAGPIAPPVPQNSHRVLRGVPPHLRLRRLRGRQCQPALAPLPPHCPRRQRRRQQRRHDAAAGQRHRPVPGHLAQYGRDLHGQLDADGHLESSRTRTSRRSAPRT